VQANLNAVKVMLELKAIVPMIAHTNGRIMRATECRPYEKNEKIILLRR